MRYFSKENIILVLVLALLVTKLIELFIPSGISKTEHEQRVKYEVLETKTKELLKQNKKLEKEYETIKQSINTDSLFIWNADRNTRDSIRAIINPS